MILLCLAGAISGLLYIPFALGNNSAKVHSLALWLGWPFGSLAVTAVCGWIGLKLADRANLPMPFLRPWELRKPGDPVERRSFVRVCFAIGGIFGLAVVLVVHILGVSPSQDPFALRVSTFPFASVVTETVAHLFVMSALILLTRRNSAAILLSAALFLLAFHYRPVTTEWVRYFDWGMNYALGVATGWVYGRYGIEGSVLTHAFAHIIILGIN